MLMFGPGLRTTSFRKRVMIAFALKGDEVHISGAFTVLRTMRLSLTARIYINAVSRHLLARPPGRALMFPDPTAGGLLFRRFHALISPCCLRCAGGRSRPLSVSHLAFLLATADEVGILFICIQDEVEETAPISRE